MSAAYWWHLYTVTIDVQIDVGQAIVAVTALGVAIAAHFRVGDRPPRERSRDRR